MATWSSFWLSAAGLGAAFTVSMSLQAHAQKQKKPPPVASEVPHAAPKAIQKQQPGAKESVEADVSARNVAVRANFTGIEIVAFGAINNSQQPSAESGYYDVIVVVEGVPAPI